MKSWQYNTIILLFLAGFSFNLLNLVGYGGVFRDLCTLSFLAAQLCFMIWCFDLDHLTIKEYKEVMSIYQKD